MVSISSFHFMDTYKKAVLGMWLFIGDSLSSIEKISYSGTCILRTLRVPSFLKSIKTLGMIPNREGPLTRSLLTIPVGKSYC
jgi:hypothetical protein